MTLEGAEIIFELQQRDGAAAGQPPAATIRATMTAGYQLLTLSEPEGQRASSLESSCIWASSGKDSELGELKDLNVTV